MYVFGGTIVPDYPLAAASPNAPQFGKRTASLFTTLLPRAEGPSPPSLAFIAGEALDREVRLAAMRLARRLAQSREQKRLALGDWKPLALADWKPRFGLLTHLFQRVWKSATADMDDDVVDVDEEELHADQNATLAFPSSATAHTTSTAADSFSFAASAASASGSGGDGGSGMHFADPLDSGHEWDALETSTSRDYDLMLAYVATLLVRHYAPLPDYILRRLERFREIYFTTCLQN